MDISEALQVNVFKLGDIYKELNKALFLEVHSHITPIVEVEPLLMKYAAKLEFGNDTRQIVEDAARIIKRMKRDWMVTGRHPAGLCGACIILAARMNNHRRSVREVVYIVKVADMTIATRLAEFKKTRSSTMSVSEFRSKGMQLKHAHDPPSLNAAAEREKKLENARRRREAREQARRTVDISDDGSNASSRQSSSAPSLAPEQAQSPHPEGTQSPSKRRRLSDQGANGQIATPDPTQESQREPRRDADGFVIPDLPVDPSLRATASRQASRQRSESVAASPAPEGEGKKKRGRPKGKPPTVKLTEADFAAEHELEDDIENILQDPQCVSAREDTEREKLVQRASHLATQQRTATAAAASARLASQGRTTPIIPDSIEIGEDEFADDPEVANALLTEEQVRVKEMIWVAHNEDWLRAQQAKHLKRALDEAEGRGPDQRVIKRRKRSRMGDGTVLTDGGTPVASPADAATRMLEKRAPKNWSKSVDYAALNRILGERASVAGSRASSTVGGSPAADSRASSPVGGQGNGAQPAGKGALTPPDTQHAIVEGLAQAVEEAGARADRMAAGEQQARAEAEGRGQGGAGDADGEQAEQRPDNEGETEEAGADEEADEDDEDQPWAGRSPGAADDDDEYDHDEDADFEAAQGDINGDFEYGQGSYGDDEEYE